MSVVYNAVNMKAHGVELEVRYLYKKGFKPKLQQDKVNNNNDKDSALKSPSRMLLSTELQRVVSMPSQNAVLT